MITTEHAVGHIRERLAGISDLYHRLVLVVGPSGSGKTTVLRAVGEIENVPVLPVGAEVARRLLDLTERQRVLQLPTMLNEAVAGLPPDRTLLDNTEVLFSPALNQDPLRLLQRISRNRTVVATWPGSASGAHLTYAEPNHPEYRRYAADGVLFVNLDDPCDQTAEGEK